MILEFKVKNFLSFKNEVTFSFEATSDKSFEDYYVTEIAPGVRILKLGIVYGANASGKSNLIEALDFIRHFIRLRKTDKTEGTGFIPFLFGETAEQPGGFDMVFYIGKTRYIYKLELDGNKVIEERLDFYPSSQPANLFHRTYNKESDSSEIEFGSKVKINKIEKTEISTKLLKNVSFFVGYNQVNYTQPEIDQAFGWFNSGILKIITPKTNLIEDTKWRFKADENLRDFTIRFMKNAQYNISDITIEENQKKDKNILDFLRKNLTEDNSNLSKKKNQNNALDYLLSISKNDKALFKHSITNNEGKKESYLLSEDQQSAGTMRYYSFSAPLFKAFQNNAFLAIDEIESSLHPHLVNHLVRVFLMEGRSYPGAQLLFTTHNISLLQEKDLLRKDAIWFTEKQEDGSTDLYSMADFDIRKELSYFKAYNTGKFGAIPNVD